MTMNIKMNKNSSSVCPLLSVASAAAGGASTARCRGEGCAWWDAAGLCCCLHVLIDSIQQSADALRSIGEKEERG